VLPVLIFQVPVVGGAGKSSNASCGLSAVKANPVQDLVLGVLEAGTALPVDELALERSCDPGFEAKAL
jgi:hypothetical protein